LCQSQWFREFAFLHHDIEKDDVLLGEVLQRYILSFASGRLLFYSKNASETISNPLGLIPYKGRHWIILSVHAGWQ